MSTTRLAGAIAVAAIAAVTLTACNPFDLLRRDEGPSVSTPTGESVSAELERYYAQQLVWTDCGDGAQCTTAFAPMDWANPTANADIQLALTRHVAIGDAVGSLFVNPGGPGGSGYDFVHDSVDFAVSSSLQGSFDVIGWDPRGVGRSTPVTCFDDAGLDDFLFGIPAAEPESPEWAAEITAASIEFGQACLANTGPSLGFVDTVSTTRDLDLLRALVGDAKLNYLGYSYGSKIATTYIDLFPAKVGRLVLDGALDPSLSDSDVLVTQTAGFEKSLHAYLTACPQLDDCPFSGNADLDAQRIARLYDRLNENPIPGADGRLMDGGVLDLATSAALYSEESWPYLNDLYAEAEAGGTETAFLLADFYYGRENGEYVDNSFESFIAVQCLDSAPVVDAAAVAAQSAALMAAAPTFSRPSILGDVLCGNWPFAVTGPAPAPASGEGADPVLVIATTGDPATPYGWGVALSEQLANGRLVSYDGEGHTAYNKESDCVNSVVDDYLIRGTVPAGTTEC